MIVFRKGIRYLTDDLHGVNFVIFENLDAMLSMGSFFIDGDSVIGIAWFLDVIWYESCGGYGVYGSGRAGVSKVWEWIIVGGMELFMIRPVLLKARLITEKCRGESFFDACGALQGSCLVAIESRTRLSSHRGGRVT